MPFRYDSPPMVDERLRQGEIVLNLLELPPSPSDTETLFNEEKSPPVIRSTHPIALIVTQDCDLYWDWKLRQSPKEVKKDIKDERKQLPHIHFCEMFMKEEIRWSRGFNRPLWERVISNQDERYHLFHQSKIADTDEQLPDLYVDFKRVFTLPTEYVYWLISSAYSTRKAIMTEPYLRDVIQRVFSYLSRVALPEDESEAI